jgi:uncharacterized protein (DUF1015 family)
VDFPVSGSEEAVPEIRPFRALRYDVEAVGDIAAVVAPPYDVISPAEHAALLARHPRNVVRLELPEAEPSDEPDDRYRRASRTLAQWRSDGTLRKDARAGVYVYEQTYRVPGTTLERTQRGFFARLRLEPFGPGSGVRPHERTLAGPREDRYKLLRATGANLSPVVVLYADPTGDAAACLRQVVSSPSEIDIRDEDDIRHRLWYLPATADAGDPASILAAAAGRSPVTIADGHHRYETALRYRDERRMTRSCEEDPPFDHLLALLLEATTEPLTVLPTHRVVHGLGADGLERLRAGIGELFEVRSVDSPAEVVAQMAPGTAPTGGGRFGLITRQHAAILQARREALSRWAPSGSEALRALDATVLGIALEQLCGVDQAAVAAGERVTYTKSADAAAEAVASIADDADVAFLLDPTPVGSILEIAEAGDVMPQKSTFFYPKALTGLVINPHEW